ncbi:prephenate dehydratase [Perkinsus olseni]|uniref:Prephenate dehydratase n=1 Tax=Perkinsus olseni TaxID=32597 RepID=A0A7J6LF03_PEROL|nr:prephenate dehydratase [Perkinsus olseni]
MGGCLSSSSYDSKVNSRRVSSSSSLLSHENSGGTLATERIHNLQHQLDECKHDLDHANGKIRDLHSVIEDKTKELDLIRGDRLEWQITATNAVVTHDHHDKHRQGQRRSNDNDEEEVIKLKNELMKTNAKWREMLKREREIRNAYERILINIGYMPNEITAGVVHVVKNILMNTHEHRRMAELQLITAAAEASNSNEEQCDDNEIDENMVDDGDVNREGDDTKEEDASSFVIQLAADIYNLHVADTDIQDVSFNHTRFLLLGRAPSPYVALHNTPIPTKVSLVFRVHDTPGSLHRSLSAFSHRGLQLCKLESRPVPPDMLDETTNLETSLVDNTSDDGEAYSNPQQHGNMAGGYYHYLCYIDVLKMPGQDKAVDRAIETLKEFNPFVRVLSVYPSSSSYHHTISPSTRSPTNLPETSHTTPPPHQGKRRSVSFIGYGKFAQFLCERLTRLCGTGGGGGSVNFSATNRKEDDTGCAHHAATLGIRYYPDMKDMLDNEKPDIIVIATSVLSFAEVVNKLSAIMKSERGRGKRKDILLVDVCSVKEYPQQVISAIVSSLTSGFGCKYSPSNGIFELREAVADDLGTRKNIQCINGSNVIITASGKAAIAAALMTILNTGDEMIIPTPCWPTFPDLALMCNATPVFIHTSSPDYAITAHSIASVITPKTRVLLLNSPCNPTGHVIPKDELIRIGALLEEHTHIMVVCDDLYERLVYDGDVHYTLAGICNPTVRSRIITIGGFSKAFAMTGLRLGYAVCSDDKWIKGMGKILGQITGCACTASQAGGLAALRDVPSSWHQKKLAQLQHKRDLLFARLQAIPNVVCPREPPKGAFYAMPDLGYYVNKMRELKGDDTLAVSQLCEQLLSSQGLSIVPGEGFYTTQPVVRLSYATSVEDINDACDRLRDFLLSLETC